MTAEASQAPYWWADEPRLPYQCQQLQALRERERREVRARAYEIHMAGVGRSTVEDAWTRALCEVKR